ncbi:hypothetical protein KDD93_06725 [Campylobacter sp. faydin G-24]|uniref:Tetratricopeptide repeat protein n=1 Tax=Campylobacter anatolicus TaxID=2829105 RepID=A0ABS5HJ03_9BACT|nr:hypothetical protein [Campylobacter anatolicus]MBR8464254.1 hypothetical protein [Campylobacter anatolicus]
MDIFFIEHRDPIFSLIVLLAIVLMIAFLSYAWGIFLNKDEKKRIEKFIKKFDSQNGLSDVHKELLIATDVDVGSLSVLATTFAKTGDFEKAISIYLIALSKVKSKSEKELVLDELGEVYFKAGFLKRANDVFLQSLQLSPRNEHALRFLTMIDEKLKNYEEALYALNSLEELGVNVRAQKAYIKANVVLDDKSLSVKEKSEKILALSTDFALLKRMSMQLWLKNGLSLAEFSDFAAIDDVIDIIYHQKQSINLSDDGYKAVFVARGILNLKEDEACEIKGFELNVIKNLNSAGYDRAELGFNYVCKCCKGSFPMYFYRCPSCHELGSVKILPHITEKTDENSMAF